MRRGWDSNPREDCSPSALAGRCFQPLSHLSRSHILLEIREKSRYDGANAPVAQWIERLIADQKVAGSNPARHTNSMTLSTPIGQVPRVGPAYEKKLQKIGITTVRDLLFHFPRTYEDFSIITPIQKLKEGNTYCVAGTLLEIKEVRTYKKRMSLITGLLEDDTGAIKITWFNQPYLADSLKKNNRILLAGKIARDKQGIYLSNPIHEKAAEDTNPTHLGRIIPVYPETAGVTSRWLRSIVKMVLGTMKEIPETLPAELLQERNFLPVKQALWQMHFPDSMKDAEQASRRF